jgi:hypothetical protein
MILLQLFTDLASNGEDLHQSTCPELLRASQTFLLVQAAVIILSAPVPQSTHSVLDSVGILRQVRQKSFLQVIPEKLKHWK